MLLVMICPRNDDPAVVESGFVDRSCDVPLKSADRSRTFKYCDEIELAWPSDGNYVALTHLYLIRNEVDRTGRTGEGVQGLSHPRLSSDRLFRECIVSSFDPRSGRVIR